MLLFKFINCLKIDHAYVFNSHKSSSQIPLTSDFFEFQEMPQLHSQQLYRKWLLTCMTSHPERQVNSVSSPGRDGGPSLLHHSWINASIPNNAENSGNNLFLTHLDIFEVFFILLFFLFFFGKM